MGRATQDVTLWSESSDYSATIDSDGELRSKTKIWDGTDTANVTPNNRLQVEANISALPATAVEYRLVKLLNGTSSAQNVDGSVTPQVFSFSPGTDETWYIEAVTFIFNDNGTANPGDYGCIAGGLTNGVLFEIKSNGVATSGQVIKNNIAVMQLFCEHPISPNSAFLGQSPTYAGIIKVNNPFILKYSTGDYIRATIRDNLTGLNYQEISVRLWREQL
jgi:hypothetical protein